MKKSTKWKSVRGGVTAPEGYFASAVACGVKESGRRDLALLFSKAPASWAAVTTRNRAPAAPVVVAREMLRRGRPLQAVVVNSGNANAATGDEGLAAAKEVSAAAADLLGVPAGSVLPSSTGIIGVSLPVGKIVSGLVPLVAGLSRRGGSAAAEGIMTTDNVRKETALEFSVAGRRVRIGGMAKGSGMIHPDMATMLAFVTTDAAVGRQGLKKHLRGAVEKTFNRISVDGDQSTNDTALVAANGLSGAEVRGGRAEALFAEALEEVCRRLAEKIVRDGEGATKFVEVAVTGAVSDTDAERAARAVANSNLVKTALYGADLNWGRILAALGCSGAALDVGRISIAVNGCPAVRKGIAVPAREGARARRQMHRREIRIAVDLGLGRGKDRVLTCDLSVEYVKENALYTT